MEQTCSASADSVSRVHAVVDAHRDTRGAGGSGPSNALAAINPQHPRCLPSQQAGRGGQTCDCVHGTWTLDSEGKNAAIVTRDGTASTALESRVQATTARATGMGCAISPPRRITLRAPAMSVGLGLTVAYCRARVWQERGGRASWRCINDQCVCTVGWEGEDCGLPLSAQTCPARKTSRPTANTPQIVSSMSCGIGCPYGTRRH